MTAGANERIIVDLPGKSLLVKRENLVLVFTSNLGANTVCVSLFVAKQTHFGMGAAA